MKPQQERSGVCSVSNKMILHCVNSVYKCRRLGADLLGMKCDWHDVIDVFKVPALARESFALLCAVLFLQVHIMQKSSTKIQQSST